MRMMPLACAVLFSARALGAVTQLPPATTTVPAGNAPPPMQDGEIPLADDPLALEQESDAAAETDGDPSALEAEQEADQYLQATMRGVGDSHDIPNALPGPTVTPTSGKAAAVSAAQATQSAADKAAAASVPGKAATSSPDKAAVSSPDKPAKSAAVAKPTTGAVASAASGDDATAHEAQVTVNLPATKITPAKRLVPAAPSADVDAREQLDQLGGDPGAQQPTDPRSAKTPPTP